MDTVHITESELVRDVRAVLDRVQSGTEIVIERDARPVAVMKPAASTARKMSEILVAMEVSGASGIVDPDFACDVEEGIAWHNEPWNPPSWD
ncbi:MAG: type II toxin-antitoxin system Phd/YefM family antitoxin [Bryobacteraceae bacterium]